MNYFVLKYKYAIEKKYNLGDNIQSIAAVKALRSCGIPPDRIGAMNRDDLARPSKNKGILIAQGWFGCRPGTAPLPIDDEEILPLFFGFHLNEGSWEYLANNPHFLASMRKHVPIGCRDFGTRDYLRSIGIEAYYSGCLTLTFPNRETAPKQRRVFLVDPLGNVETSLPPLLQQNIVRLAQEAPFPSGIWPISENDVERVHELALERLSDIRDRASLVLTRRIHIALPCLAMGVPVIFTFDQPDNPRVSMIKEWLTIYSTSDYPGIDWNPAITDVDSEKERILRLVRYRLQTLERHLGLETEARLSEAESELARACLEKECQETRGATGLTVNSYSRDRFTQLAFSSQQIEQLANGTPLFLFGGGAAGIQLKQILEYFGYTVHRFCDNNAREDDNRLFEGIPVIGARHLFDECRNSLIFISTLNGYAAIKTQLISNGIPESQIAGSASLISKFSHFAVPESRQPTRVSRYA